MTTPVTTEVIRYNLRERGRKYRGVERNFDIPALVKAINSPATQERVKHRDMLGYYGHWPRQVFGINPREGGIVDGQVVHIEPAFVTTHLKAYDDGTIEHRTEFFDNAPGRAALMLYKGKGGGWSSAIDERKAEFWGFDYVLEPNFSTNRGYAVALDSAVGMTLTLDDVQEYYDSAAEIALMLDAVNSTNEKLRAELARTQQALIAVQADRIDAERALDRALAKRDATLDSIVRTGGRLSIKRTRGSTSQLFDRAEEYIGRQPAERRPEVATLDAASVKTVEAVHRLWRM